MYIAFDVMPRFTMLLRNTMNIKQKKQVPLGRLVWFVTFQKVIIDSPGSACHCWIWHQPGICAAVLAAVRCLLISLSTKPEAERKLRLLASSRDPGYLLEVRPVVPLVFAASCFVSCMSALMLAEFSALRAWSLPWPLRLCGWAAFLACRLKVFLLALRLTCALPLHFVLFSLPGGLQQGFFSLPRRFFPASR